MSILSTTNDTLNRFTGDGTTTQFPYNFTNYVDGLSIVSACVVDSSDIQDVTYTFIELAGSIIELNKVLAADRFLNITLEVSDTPVTVFDNSTRKITDTNLNAVINQLIVTAQEAKDHRTNPRHFNLDVNGHRITNAADAIDDTDVGTFGQFKAIAGDAAGFSDAAEISATAAAISETNSATSATNAGISETNSATSATESAVSASKAKDKFQGDWNITEPGGYDIGETVLYLSNQYECLIDGTTDNPEFGASLPTPSWIFFLPGAINSEELVADIHKSIFNGDGVTTDFNLTAIDPNFKPTNNNHIFFVSVDTNGTIEFNIIVDGSGDSILVFNSPPPANTDPVGTYNILIIGATPKLVNNNVPVPIANTYIKADATGITYESLTVAEVKTDLGVGVLPKDHRNYSATFQTTTTINWVGECRSDDNTTDLITGSAITATLSGAPTNSTRHMFVGFDGVVLKAEFTADVTGATGLSLIDGAKRRVLSILTDGAGNIIDETWNLHGDTIVATLSVQRDLFNASSGIPTTQTDLNALVPINIRCRLHLNGNISSNNSRNMSITDKNSGIEWLFTRCTAGSAEQINDTSAIFSDLSGNIQHRGIATTVDFTYIIALISYEYQV